MSSLGFFTIGGYFSFLETDTNLFFICFGRGVVRHDGVIVCLVYIRNPLNLLPAFRIKNFGIEP